MWHLLGLISQPVVGGRLFCRIDSIMSRIVSKHSDINPPLCHFAVTHGLARVLNFRESNSTSVFLSFCLSVQDC
jgi:hypothetical protein